MHRGCVPTKSFLRVAEVLDTARKSKRFGVTTGEATLDFAKMIDYKNQVIRTVLSGLRNLMKNHAIEVVEGVGKLILQDRIASNIQKREHLFPIR